MINENLNEVRLMHETMMSMNNENAYYSWIYTMPDCPTEDDFIDFAKDNEEFNSLKATFSHILKHYADSGLYDASPDVVNYARRYIPDIEDLQGHYSLEPENPQVKEEPSDELER